MSLQRYLERLIWWCMLPLIGLGSLLLFLHLQTLEERRQMFVDSVARAAALSLDQMIEVRLNSLSLLGRLLEGGRHLRNGQLDLAQAHELSMTYLRQQGNHVVIGSATADMLINTRVPLGQALPPMPEESMKSGVMVAVTRKSPAVSDPFVGPIAGEYMVTLAVPLELPQAQQLVLLTSLETRRLRDRMAEELQLPEGWVLRVETRTGRQVFSIPEGAPDQGLAQAGDGPWRVADLNQAPWTAALLAPPVSPLDRTGARTLVLLSALSAAAIIVYAGAHKSAVRLSRAISALTPTMDSKVAMIDIHEVAQVKAELVRLDRERQAAQEDERRRIGLELHDDLQQKLALIRQDLVGLPADTHRDRALSWVDESIAATRRLVMDLHPPVLHEVGLPATLAALCQQHQEVFGQAVDFLAPTDEHWLELPDTTALALYRITQEALNNARKHAHARAVHVGLSGTPGGEAILEVVDDGVGFHRDPDTRQAGNGLRGMQERAQALGGRLEVTTAPGDGAAVLARLPWPLAQDRKG